MTPERQNEIWAMLPIDLKNKVRYCFAHTDDFYSFKDLLDEIFGHNNFTAQTEEKPNEPKFKVGDRVRVLDNTPLVSNIGKIATIIKKGECCNGYGWVLDISKSVFLESELEPYTTQADETTQKSPFHGENEPNLRVSEREMTQKSPSEQNSQTILQSANHIPDSTKMVDYAQYRLDLAKEIAVAVIQSDRLDFHSCNPVEQANEIVKRLKETEE